jgi:site-specific DNA recombinase
MRIALYARVSTQRQAQQQTVEQQLERLRAHVAVHAAQAGWQIRDEHVFRDDGLSGATLHRPGLDRLRDAVAARALDLVMVTAPDRSGPLRTAWRATMSTRCCCSKNWNGADAAWNSWIGP